MGVLRHTSLLAAFTLLTGCVTGALTSGPVPDGTIIDVSTPIHFQSLSDTDQTVEPGLYRVSQADPSGLLLQDTATARSIVLKAESTTHNQQLRGPLALTVPDGDDARHIVLLLPNGQSLDANGSLSGVQSRATISPLASRMMVQQSAQVLPRSKLALLAVIPPDPCAGAIPSLPAPPPPLVNLPQITPGQGPIADVVDWQPKNKIPAGREIIIQGRNFDPAGLYASIGGTRLLPTTKSASEVRFTVPTGLRAFNATFVVFQQGGTPRTLETNYEVFDPAVRITRVVPETFSQGDLVTLCGVSVSHINLLGSVGVSYSNNVLNSQTKRLARIGANPQLSPNSPSRLVETLNPVGSPSGDRLTFVAGSLYKDYMFVGTGGAYALAVVSDQTPPSTVSGALQLHSEVNQTTSNDVISPTPVTWQLGGPKFTGVGPNPTASGFGLNEPFVILPPVLSNNTTFYRVVQFKAQGYNLAGQYRLGATPLNGGSTVDPLPSGESYTLLGVAPTASSGQICGTQNGITNCWPQSFTVLPGPVMATMPWQLPAPPSLPATYNSTGTAPPLPLKVRTVHTIDGLYLQPSGVPGLTYEVQMPWLDPGKPIYTTSGPTYEQCNMGFTVLEHTANRIRFQIGDPARPAPSGECLAKLTGFMNQSYPTLPFLLLKAKYGGKESQLALFTVYLTQ